MESKSTKKKTTARKKSSGSTSLPKKIELIDTKTGAVKEFSTEHATKILNLEKLMHVKAHDIFNTELYTYDEGLQKISRRQEQPTSDDRSDSVTEGGKD